MLASNSTSDLRLDGLTVRLPGHAAPVLRGAALRVSSGTTAGLLGRSGSGKTTLLHTVSGLLPWLREGRVDGSIELAGEMIAHVNRVLSDIQRVFPDHDPAQGYEIAGFVWFQGWNDMCDGGVYPDRNQPGGYDLYSELLAHHSRENSLERLFTDGNFEVYQVSPR